MKYFIQTILFLVVSLGDIGSRIYANSPTLYERTDSVWGMEWHSVKEQPEWGNGCRGKAIRTDGYSTYLNAELESGVKAIDTWFALESYPTDTASCIALLDKYNQLSFSLCVTRFGDLVAITRNLDKGTLKTFSLQKRINCFEWFNIALSMEKDYFSCFLNGKQLTNIPLKKEKNVTDKWLLRFGKDFFEKKVGMYDVTCINGLIDRPCFHSLFKIEQLEEEALIVRNSTPVLAPVSRFKDDFNRPTYHLLPAANWTNETHGLFYYKDKYHIFNQKNASSIFLGQINWGHFTSPDLIHWTEEKPALTPDMDYDKKGIWSGCAILNDKGTPQLFYTSGGDKNGIGIAFPADNNLVAWDKYEKNPVIYGQPKGFTRTDMRDPFVWKEGNVWYMIIGYGIEDPVSPHGALLLYKSTDAKKWDYVHLMFEGNPEIDESGVFWEMPFFKKFGEKYVLLVNRVPHNRIPARSQYWIGKFENEKFIPDNPVPQNLEVINRLLSPSIWQLSDTSTVAIAIIPDEISESANYKQGWAHLYSIPRMLSLKDGKKLVQHPYSGLKSLRGKHVGIEKRRLTGTSVYSISNTEHQVELCIDFYPKDATKFGVIIGKNPAGTEQTSIYFDLNMQELVIDQTRSSLREGIPQRIRKDKYSVKKDEEKINLHLFIDGSVVEGFINNEDAFTTRVFPLYENSTQIEIFSNGKNSEVKADIWQLEDAKVKTNF